MEASESEPVSSTVHVGPLFSSDQFYSTRPELTEPFVRHGILGVEMEAAGLYTLAAFHGRRALRDLHGQRPHRHPARETTAQEREQTFGDMVRIALRAATSV
ncbi:hypothetical protein AB1285_17750 [Microbacterium sp. NRRL B-14842]|uniref:phosphorylase family protein n=1 Tax=Microbacterium sp. NRRL B-14842 TaxID=3162881 RepID=UPI003D2B18E7